MYSLAAVDSPEAGVLYLSSWAEQVRDATLPRVQWYMLRAKINFSQLAATPPLNSSVDPERRVIFQRRMTDEFAELIGLGMPELWSTFCKDIKDTGIHGRVGGRLVLTYALERNYLFELEEPGLVQSWLQARRRELTDPLWKDLTEASAIEKLSECFNGLRLFDANREQWLGQFELNAAQLRIALLPARADSQMEAELKEIRKLLDSAQRRLASSSPPLSNEPLANQLLGNDSFGDQRRRAQSLQLLIAKSSPSP
jgi:hypothetical protein